MESPGESDPPQGLVFVLTGGSGFLGSHLVPLLLEARLRELRVLDIGGGPRVRWLWGDVGDPGAVGRALAGADVVLHAASVIDVWDRVTADVIARVNVQGTRHVLAGCRAGGVRVLVYTSTMEVVGPNARGDPFLRGDESTAYPTRHTQPYPRSKAQAERLVLAANGSAVAGGSRLVTVALRPTGIYGERHPLMAEFYRGARAAGGVLPHTIPPHAEHARVYAGNVAWMHILAVRAALSCPGSVGGESFFCYDSSPLDSYESFNARLLTPAGLRRGGPSIPPALVALFARFNSFLAAVLRGYSPLLTPYTWAVASTPFSVRTNKAERCFGYRPLYGWEEARDRTVAWIRTLGDD
ncbi:LOW QUALITY PROTEIN: 3 beta-hydroxysteroid dehydrogenase type 7-like [Aegotheles albertisi]